jgi:hypothetical protein
MMIKEVGFSHFERSFESTRVGFGNNPLDLFLDL